MDKKEMILTTIKVERDYSKRQVLQSIKVIRRILDQVEEEVDNGNVRADNGLQGNEWRLYKELSNLERYNQFIEELEKL
ncbi:hypothetical protein [Sporosarcina sp. FSL W7-1283]|uniref:hypothetical protein n=1 Tax=Sporosarcina sp. FSL W7-1283 TaxID=2921560 RepID=UPI0030F4BA0B